MGHVDLYTKFLKKYFSPEADQPKADKRKLKVVFDCSNGTTGIILTELFRKFQIPNSKFQPKAIFINHRPDGNFPGHGPNPMAPGAIRQLQKAVLKHRADLGFIFDADGDRVFLVDDKGRSVHPDETGYLLLQTLKPKKYAVSIISGKLLKVNSYKSKVSVSRVGHYFFKKLMREKNIPLGLEHSGHYYFHFPEFRGAIWDSGILTAIHIINFISKLDQPMPTGRQALSEYLDKLPKYHRSGEINFKFQASTAKAGQVGIKCQDILKKVEKFYKKQKTKISKLDGLTAELPDFWVNIRPSNTENLLRLNMEARNKKLLIQELKRIKHLLK